MNSFKRPSPPSMLPQISPILFTLLFLTSACSAFVPRNSLGVLKMCPPGGDAFASAWQLTCGMRKKRSIPSPSENLSSSQFKFLPDSPTPSSMNELIAEDVTEMDSNSKTGLLRNRRAASSSSSAADPNQFRPLRLTEMMHFCCRYGCSFRDLLPYCDPFGSWDS